MHRAHRQRPSRALAIVTALLLVVTSTGRAQSTPTLQPVVAPATVGVVLGTAWRSLTTPYPQARIRLRNVETGRAVARTVAGSDGSFRFDRVEPGVYAAELLSDGDRVLAIGDLFGVAAGGQATTLVRLSSKAPWFAAFFGNAAIAAIAAAATLGVTAVGSNGNPASGQ